MQETHKNCFVQKKNNTTFRQVKIGKNEYSKLQQCTLSNSSVDSTLGTSNLKASTLMPFSPE